MSKYQIIAQKINQGIDFPWLTLLFNQQFNLMNFNSRFNELMGKQRTGMLSH